MAFFKPDIFFFGNVFYVFKIFSVLLFSWFVSMFSSCLSVLDLFGNVFRILKAREHFCSIFDSLFHCVLFVPVTSS